MKEKIQRITNSKVYKYLTYVFWAGYFLGLLYILNLRIGLILYDIFYEGDYGYGSTLKHSPLYYVFDFFSIPFHGWWPYMVGGFIFLGIVTVSGLTLMVIFKKLFLKEKVSVFLIIVALCGISLLLHDLLT